MKFFLYRENGIEYQGGGCFKGLVNVLLILVYFLIISFGVCRLWKFF